MRKKTWFSLVAGLAAVLLLSGCLAGVVPDEILSALFGESSSAPSASVSSQVAESTPRAPKPPAKAPESTAPEAAASGTGGQTATGQEVADLFDALEGQWVDANEDTVMYFYNDNGVYGVALGFYNSEYVSNLRLSGVEKVSGRVYRLYFDQNITYMPDQTVPLPESATWLEIDLGESGDNLYTLNQIQMEGEMQEGMNALDYHYDTVNN